MELGRMTEARSTLEMSLGYPRVHVRLRCYSNLAILHYESMNYSLAADAAKAVLSMNRSYESKELNRLGIAILGLVSVELKDWSLARDCYESLCAHRGATTAFEDTSYSTMFLARVALQEGGYVEGLTRLRQEAERVHHTHKLASLRLKLEASRILAGIDEDRAFAEASEVAADAATLTAEHLRRRAIAVSGSLRQ